MVNECIEKECKHEEGNFWMGFSPVNDSGNGVFYSHCDEWWQDCDLHDLLQFWALHDNLFLRFGRLETDWPRE